jgi:hypothetical protein
MAQIPIILSQVLLTLILTLIKGKTFKYTIYRILKCLVDRTDNRLDNDILEKLREDWEIPVEVHGNSPSNEDRSK